MLEKSQYFTFFDLHPNLLFLLEYLPIINTSKSYFLVLQNHDAESLSLTQCMPSMNHQLCFLYGKCSTVSLSNCLAIFAI